MTPATAVALPRGTTASLGPEARLTPQLRATAVQAVAGGVRRQAALILAGIPQRTAELWLAVAAGRVTRWPDGSPLSDSTLRSLTALAAEFALAEAQRERSVIETIVKATEAVNPKTGIPEWRAGAWLMEHGPAWKRDYAEYREQRIEHTGQVSLEHRLVQGLSYDQLGELITDPEWKDL